jgi:hypothetical protein
VCDETIDEMAVDQLEFQELVDFRRVVSRSACVRVDDPFE